MDPVSTPPRRIPNEVLFLKDKNLVLFSIFKCQPKIWQKSKYKEIRVRTRNEKSRELKKRNFANETKKKHTAFFRLFPALQSPFSLPSKTNKTKMVDQIAEKIALERYKKVRTLCFFRRKAETGE